MVRHRRAVVVGWLLLVVVCGFFALGVQGEVRGSGWDVPGSSTVRAQAELGNGLTGRGPTGPVLVIRDERFRVGDPAFSERTQAAYRTVAADASLKVTSAFGWGAQDGAVAGSFVGRDGRTVITSLGSAMSNDEAIENLPGIQTRLREKFQPQGLDVSLVSVQAYLGAVNDDTVTTLVKSEAIALPLIALVLLLLFRSVAATITAMLPTLTAIVATLGIVGLIAKHLPLSILVENVALMFGLGVGVDYALLLVKRFKEEVSAGNTIEQSIATMYRTAVRSTVVSGITIIIATLPLYLVPLNAVRSMALGAGLSVAVSVLVSVVVTPAVLAIVGKRVEWGRIRLPGKISNAESASDEELIHHRWYRWTVGVMRRPVVFLISGVVVLLIAAIPVTHASLNIPPDKMLAEGSPTRDGFENIAEGFGPGAAFPIQVVISGIRLDTSGDIPARVSGFVDDIGRMPSVAAVNSAVPLLDAVSPDAGWAVLQPGRFATVPPDVQTAVRYFISRDNQRTVVEVVSRYPADDERTMTLVRDVRASADQMFGASHVAIGGQTSRSIDVNTLIADIMPEITALMLLGVFLVLLLGFRSLLLPIKAVLLNLLSLGATFGILVAIFEWGYGAGVLGVDAPGYLVDFLPPLILAMLVGLSSDYEVFLLGRVQEEYLRGKSNSQAVATGMARTAPLITGAGFLMIVVFAAFGLAGNMVMQQMGIGLAIAVALDVTIIRAVLVPSAMKLMGAWNWWGPRWLKPPRVKAGASDGPATRNEGVHTSHEDPSRVG